MPAGADPIGPHRPRKDFGFCSEPPGLGAEE